MSKLKNFLTPKTFFYIGLLALAFYFMYECPFEHLIGVCCPGCGMTRAFISLIKLDFVAAFHYHPLFPLVIIIALYMILRYFQIFRFNVKYEGYMLYAIVIIFFIVYFIRMFGDSSVVYVDFSNSLFGKLVNFIF